MEYHALLFNERVNYMTKYLINRIIRSCVSIVIAVGIVMLLIYSLMDRNLIFKNDALFTHLNNNSKVVYKYQKWEEYGYLDYMTYQDYLNLLVANGELTEAVKNEVSTIGYEPSKDSKLTTQYIESFYDYCDQNGYTPQRLNAVTQRGTKVADGGKPQLFAYKDINLFVRLFNYFGGILKFDDINYVADIENRGLSFTLHDPVYGGEKFSPAIIGNGTYHKYLVYFDNQFPYFHQNLVTVNLGTSYSVNQGVDVFSTMTTSQGSYVKSLITYPSGLTEESADDLHSATYIKGSQKSSYFLQSRFTDDYTNTTVIKNGKSKIGYSFSIGIISVIIDYLLGVPLGIIMARKKDSFIDQLGSIYIIFIIAVPSLAYIFLFKAIGSAAFGLPTTFDVDSLSKAMYVLPIISLSLPSIANLMKWIRRYMIDQQNLDYVKFARSGGLTENEIFTKHILKNAIIPIVHGIPGSILGAITGAIITERVYVVPGAGNLLTKAINNYDNGVIVGVTLFYAILSVASMVCGDILMSMIDPRISFTSKAR